jgi:hypothetical protein
METINGKRDKAMETTNHKERNNPMKEIDCTNYCGPQMDGKLCPGCKMPTIWVRKRKGELSEMEAQTAMWGGDVDKKGNPTWRRDSN